jgi:hypothetical protein
LSSDIFPTQPESCHGGKPVLFMKNDDSFDHMSYMNNSYIMVSFFKGFATSRLCQRLEGREPRSLEEHPPLADLRQVHLASNLKRAVSERSTSEAIL